MLSRRKGMVRIWSDVIGEQGGCLPGYWHGGWDGWLVGVRWESVVSGGSV